MLTEHLVQRLARFILQGGLAHTCHSLRQTFVLRGLRRQIRQDVPQIGLPALVGTAVSLDQPSATCDLQGQQRVVGARTDHSLKPMQDVKLLSAKAATQGAQHARGS